LPAEARLIKTLVSSSAFDRGSLSPTYVKPCDVFAKGVKLEKGSPHWTISATVHLGLRRAKGDESRRTTIFDPGSSVKRPEIGAFSA
jgi:hypothetical protein